MIFCSTNKLAQDYEVIAILHLFPHVVTASSTDLNAKLLHQRCGNLIM